MRQDDRSMLSSVIVLEIAGRIFVDYYDRDLIRVLNGVKYYYFSHYRSNGRYQVPVRGARIIDGYLRTNYSCNIHQTTKRKFLNGRVSRGRFTLARRSSSNKLRHVSTNRSDRSESKVNFIVGGYCAVRRSATLS